jgi:predicted nucleic acid-binding Zn ribbon protein
VKIVAVTCNSCAATFEILENFPQELLHCPGCESKDLKLTKTGREFKGCGGGCGDCSSCS